MIRKRILITGYSSTQKTRLGDYLQKKHRYHHENVEDWRDRDARFGGSNGLVLIGEEIDRINQIESHIVATFGFRPNSSVDICIVEIFIQKGFDHIWFGNRNAARKFALQRESEHQRPQGNFKLHVVNIDKTNILSRIKYKEYDPFTVIGDHKSLGLISEELGLSSLESENLKGNGHFHV